MTEYLKAYFRYFTRPSVWVLILPALVFLAFTDQALVKTLLQWSAFALVLAGISILISMIIFPQISLSHLVADAERGSLPSAIIAAALLVFFGLLFFSIVFWAKA